MLNNAGKKIVFWSNILLVLGIAVSVVLGFMMIWRGAQTAGIRFSVYHTGYLAQTGYLGSVRVVIAGFLVMIFGSLASWLAALLLRAFGDLAEDTKAIRERLEETPAEADAVVEIETEAPTAEEPEKKPAKPRTRKPGNPKPADTKSEETTEA